MVVDSCGEQILRGAEFSVAQDISLFVWWETIFWRCEGVSQLPIYSAALSLWEMRLGGQSEKHLSKLGSRKDFGLRTVSCSGKNCDLWTFKCLFFTWIGSSSCKNERRFWGHRTCNQKGRLNFGVGVEYRGQPRAGKHKWNALSTVLSGCFQIHSCLSAGLLVWQSQRWQTTQSF